MIGVDIVEPKARSERTNHKLNLEIFLPIRRLAYQVRLHKYVDVVESYRPIQKEVYNKRDAHLINFRWFIDQIECVCLPFYFQMG